MENQGLQTTSQDGVKLRAAEIAISNLQPIQRQTMINATQIAEWQRRSEAEKIESLKEAIAIVGVTINAKPPTDNDEILAYELTINQILRHYPATTGAEIVQAFELNCTGKEWETIDAFGRFDFPLFGKVMKAYQEYRRKAVREFNIKLTAAVKELSIPKKTPEQIQKESYDFITNYFREHGEWPYGDYHNAWIHFWYKFGLKRIDVEEWFKKTSALIVEELRQRMKVETSDLNIEAMRLQLNPEAIKAECRRRFFQQYHEKNQQS